jgi:hypothetical protein
MYYDPNGLWTEIHSKHDWGGKKSNPPEIEPGPRKHQSVVEALQNAGVSDEAIERTSQIAEPMLRTGYKYQAYIILAPFAAKSAVALGTTGTALTIGSTGLIDLGSQYALEDRDLSELDYVRAAEMGYIGLLSGGVINSGWTSASVNISGSTKILTLGGAAYFTYDSALNAYISYIVEDDKKTAFYLSTAGLGLLGTRQLGKMVFPGPNSSSVRYHYAPKSTIDQIRSSGRLLATDTAFPEPGVAKAWVTHIPPSEMRGPLGWINRIRLGFSPSPKIPTLHSRDGKIVLQKEDAFIELDVSGYQLIPSSKFKAPFGGQEYIKVDVIIPNPPVSGGL